MKKYVYLFIILVVVGVFWGYSTYSSALRYSLNPDSANRVTVSIEQGSTAAMAAEALKEKGLIKSTHVFRYYLKQKKLEDQLKAGRYVFKESQTLPQIVEKMVAGQTDEFAVTLLEGWTVKQMAAYLESEGVTTVDSFLTCLESCSFEFDFLPAGPNLEGYLYPDTYFVDAASYTDEKFIRRLIQTLEGKLSDEDWKALEASGRSFQDIMIMASIVEREERNNEEKSTVAGILWNRLDNGMSLGADATVLYALGRTSGGLTAKDLQIDSPYNTRKYAGLPPTPIANPSITSIRAALYPEETDYFYYLHDPEGGIHYGRTLEEHNENKAKYLN